MQYQVMRPFHGGGRDLKPGDVVEDDGWPTGRAARLVAQRMLMPAGVGGDVTLPRIGTRRPHGNDPAVTGRKR